MKALIKRCVESTRSILIVKCAYSAKTQDVGEISFWGTYFAHMFFIVPKKRQELQAAFCGIDRIPQAN